MNNDEHGDANVPNSSYFSAALVATKAKKDMSSSQTEILAQPQIDNMYAWLVRKETFTTCMSDVELAAKHQMLQEPFRNVIKPKVQQLVHPPPRNLPKQVEEERRRRKFDKQSLAEMLQQAKVKYTDLLPIPVLNEELCEEEKNDKFGSTYSLFPLEWFDDADLDTMTSNEWLNIQEGSDNPQDSSVPALAFLPPPKDSQELQFESQRGIFEWKKALVRSYDVQTDTWFVQDLQTRATYNIPRIYIKFFSEDAAIFVNRLVKAIEFRKLCEKHFKFGLIVDSMTLIGANKATKSISDKIGKYILNKATRKYIQTQPVYVELLKDIHDVEYQRVMIELELRYNLQKFPDDYSFVQLPADEVVSSRVAIVTGMEDYGLTRRIMKQITMYCLAQPIIAMKMVVEDCQKVSSMSLYVDTLRETSTLDDFREVQNQTSSSVLRYLQEEWNEQLAHKIRMCLRDAGKGWFDINLSSWEVFMVSKIFFFMELVRFRMESALRDLILKSTQAYENLLCIPCRCLMHVQPDYKWGVNVIFSPFEPPRLHVFYLVMEMNESGAYYSTDPAEFEPTILNLYDDVIRESHNIHLVTPKVMHELIFSKDLFLTSVGLMEKVIADRRQLLIDCYEKALIPLKAYARQYAVHVKLFMLNVDEHILATRESKKPSHEIKEEISMHMRMKENLEVTLPMSITIGPFLINVQPLRTFLINKRRELTLRMLVMLTEILKEKTVHIDAQYKEIFRMLSQKPESIEHIYEIKEWMETLPETVKAVEEAMRTILFEYEILDNFTWPLPDDDFRLKWDAIAWPNTILNQVDLTKEMHEVETEQFMKQQTADEGAFTERVEAFNVVISTYATQVDTSKTTELAIEINKNWKQLEDLLQLGELLNRRQLLFEFPPIDLDDLKTLIQNFIPYRTLWITGAEFNKWREAWCGNPLSNIVIASIEQSMVDYQKILDDLLPAFDDLPNIVAVNRYFYDAIEDFKMCVKVMADLKNPSWLIPTWQKLTIRTGLVIKYTPNLNFETCMEAGIMDFADVVKEISDQSTQDKLQSDMEAAEAERVRKEKEDALAAKRKVRMDRTDI